MSTSYILSRIKPYLESLFDALFKGYKHLKNANKMMSYLVGDATTCEK